MSRFLLTAIVGAFVSACATSNAELEETRETIEKLGEEVRQATNALDLNRFLSYLARDTGLIVIADGHMMVGWDAFSVGQREHWATLFRVEFTVETTRVTVFSPDLAIATNTGTALEVPRAGEHRQGRFVSTLVWRRRAEGWRIVQAHESTSP